MLDICFGEARRLAERTSDVSAGLCLCALRKNVADAYLSWSKVINLMINAFHFTLGNRLRVRGEMRILFFVAGSLFAFAASAQTYPVSGVWIAKDYQLRQFTAGECFALKTFGVDALFDGSFPTVMIFRTTSDLWCEKVTRPSERSDLLKASRMAVF